MNQATNDDYSILFVLATQDNLVDVALTPSAKQALARLQFRGLVVLNAYTGVWVLTSEGIQEIEDLKRGEK